MERDRDSTRDGEEPKKKMKNINTEIKSEPEKRENVFLD